MKVVLSTTGRFHMFALARELEQHGMLDAIYSGFNWGALKREKLPRNRVRTFPFVRAPMMAMGRFGVNIPTVSNFLFDASFPTLDAYVWATLPNCDVFVGHEAAGLWSGALAKKRGAVYVCDRGCTHAGWRQALMQEEYDRVGVKFPGRPRTFAREIEEYETSDHIVVPSNFSRDSFLAEGIKSDKVTVVPYGVSLDVFHPEVCEPSGYFEVLFVGHLSVRKGAHDLLRAFDILPLEKKRLTIVGTISQDIRAALNRELSRSDVRVLGPIPQTKLKNIMGASDALVLPSVEEGLALVQVEALACGCPIVATTNTGAVDLITDGKEGFIVPIRSPEAIADRLLLLATDQELLCGMRSAAIQRVRTIGGWAAYGERMVALYSELCGLRRGAWQA